MMCAYMRRRPCWTVLSMIALGGCAPGTIVGELPQSSGGDVGDPGTPPDAAVKPPNLPDAPPPPDAGLPDAGGDPPPTFDVTDLTRDSVLSIAEASVGYTYWWGHGSLGGT